MAWEKYELLSENVTLKRMSYVVKIAQKSLIHAGPMAYGESYSCAFHCTYYYFHIVDMKRGVLKISWNFYKSFMQGAVT